MMVILLHLPKNILTSDPPLASGLNFGTYLINYKIGTITKVYFDLNPHIFRKYYVLNYVLPWCIKYYIINANIVSNTPCSFNQEKYLKWKNEKKLDRFYYTKNMANKWFFQSIQLSANPFFMKSADWTFLKIL